PSLRPTLSTRVPCRSPHMLHLGSALAASHFASQPYPHYVVSDALPAPLYGELAARLPPDDAIRQGGEPGDNRRFSWSAQQTLVDARLDPLWREFVAAHVSQAFLDSVLAAFASAIRDRYPRSEERRVGKEWWTRGAARRKNVL